MKKDFITFNNVTGNVRVLKPLSHIRLNWKMENWENNSILQLRTIDNNGVTIVGIHQEKLLNSTQRIQMKEHWGNIMNDLEKDLHSS